MMADVGHEMVEVLTDEMPGAFWYNRVGRSGDTVANNLEAADVCEHKVQPDGGGWLGRSTEGRVDQDEFRLLPWEDSGGRSHTMVLDGYYSNKDHACIAPVTDLVTGAANGSLLREQDGTVWVVFGGARFHVPDVGTLNRLYQGVQVVPAIGVAHIPTIPMDGTLLREEDGALWVVFGEARFHVPNVSTLTRLYSGRPISELWNGGPAQIPTVPADGSLLREEDGFIWLIARGARFHVPDLNTLNRLKAGRTISELWNGALNGIPRFPSDGTLLREDDGTIWVIIGGARFHVPDPPTLSRLFGGQPIVQLWNGAASGISTVPIVDGTLLREESSSQVYVVKAGHKARAPQGVAGSVHVLWDGALSQIPNAGAP
jgi:hypothetical protein